VYPSWLNLAIERSQPKVIGPSVQIGSVKLLHQSEQIPYVIELHLTAALFGPLQLREMRSSGATMVTGSLSMITLRRRENSSWRYTLSFLTTQSTLTTNAWLIMLNMD
jgi:hypothetical protein